MIFYLRERLILPHKVLEGERKMKAWRRRTLKYGRERKGRRGVKFVRQGKSESLKFEYS